MGEISVSLTGIEAPVAYRLTLFSPDSEIRNFSDLWVYPTRIEAEAEDVVVARNWGDARAALEQGIAVVLLAHDSDLPDVAGCFQTDFWCYAMFKQFDPPGTLGILCDSKHPALAQFPTERHSDWQWFDVLKNSRSLILDALPADFLPIVQVIDNPFRNHKLGNLFEARVGAGRLLVCSMDIETDLKNRPVARQLRHSILSYVASTQFAPQRELTMAQLDDFFGPTTANQATETIRFHQKGEQELGQSAGFGLRSQTSLALEASCPPGFNGLLRVLITGLGQAEVWFQNRRETSIELNEAGVWCEISTAQKAWAGALEVRVVPTQNSVARIAEWMIIE